MGFNGKKGSEKPLLRRGSKKGLSRRHLEGRNTPFPEYDPLGVCPINLRFFSTVALESFLGLSLSTVGSPDWFQGWFRKEAHRFSQSLFQPYSETT